MPTGETVTVEGRRLTLTNLDKVLYPASGTTKADVLAYLAAVAPVLLPHVANRPVTRKRWPNGTAGQVFFTKNLDSGTPDWVRRRGIDHASGTNTYPLVNDLATLTWLGQMAALELHVPQWQFGRTGVQRAPDRLVLDLDPGPGVGLAECAEVARWAREILTGMGLNPLPVTSGSKGIHLYAALDGRQDAAAVCEVAHELARYLESEHPDLVVSDMKKSLRPGKVFVDWSQNNGNKTTVAPYSLRGRERPWVAAPRTWDELEDPGLAHLDADAVVARVEAIGDPLAPVLAGRLAALEPTPDHLATFERLAPYRAKRHADRTPEPGTAAGTAAPADSPGPSADSRLSFVIQEHDARRHHYDFRLEHDGVLVSWALPKGEPTDPKRNHLAVQTEDHPLAYGDFEGTIPAGEYGGGTVRIWDAGSYETEKWRDGEEVIVTLHGERQGTRRLALIHPGGRGGAGANDWLIHLMAPRPDAAPAEAAPPPLTPPAPRPAKPGPALAARLARYSPMLATAGTPADLATGAAWAFELKWDGFRALTAVDATGVRVASRSGQDMTATFPEVAALLKEIDPADLPLVLDGEIIAPGQGGRPDFRRLQQRSGLTRPGDVATARAQVPVAYLVFDVLEVAGRPVVERPYDERRAELARVLAAAQPPIHVPAELDGGPAAAVETGRRLGLEGVVAKRRDSLYSSRRSHAWVKLKNTLDQEVVVIGWRPGTGHRTNLLGSLLLAVPDGDQLRYVGRVGSGFTDAERRLLPTELGGRRRADAPAVDVPAADARDARWVEPDRVGEVRFTGWTGAPPGGGARRGTGTRLRQPVWRGWRPDRKPDDIPAPAGDPAPEPPATAPPRALARRPAARSRPQSPSGS